MLSTRVNPSQKLVEKFSFEIFCFQLVFKKHSYKSVAFANFKYKSYCIDNFNYFGLKNKATYARAFQIVKKFNTPNLVYLGIDSEPFVNPSIYTSEEGILSYYEVCEMMTNKETRVYWDDLSEAKLVFCLNPFFTRVFISFILF